jgi:hypothetical protein
MKRAAALIWATIFFLAAIAFGQETPKKPDMPRPISALSWLVGGVWTADASKMGPGMQRIETR